jgi:hypothetical protein
MSSDGTQVEQNFPSAISPPELGLICLYRGLGFRYYEIAEMVDRHENTIQRKVCEQKRRVEAGEDPVQVWSELLDPLYEEDTHDE